MQARVSLFLPFDTVTSQILTSYGIFEAFEDNRSSSLIVHLALREYGLVNTALRVRIMVWMWFVMKPKPNEEICRTVVIASNRFSECSLTMLI